MRLMFCRPQARQRWEPEAQAHSSHACLHSTCACMPDLIQVARSHAPSTGSHCSIHVASSRCCGRSASRSLMAAGHHHPGTSPSGKLSLVRPCNHRKQRTWHDTCLSLDPPWCASRWYFCRHDCQVPPPGPTEAGGHVCISSAGKCHPSHDPALSTDEPGAARMARFRTYNSLVPVCGCPHRPGQPAEPSDRSAS